VKITVVTPSFAQLDWLELCIASVADQHFLGSIEHIVCDGGTEGIEEFKKRMLARFPETPHYRLEFIIGPDSGMYDAINKGLRLAKGDICSYLNCDEQLLPNALKDAGDFFGREAEIDVVFGDAIVVNSGGEALCYWRPYVPSLAHLAGATLNTLSCSTFFRHRIIESGHFFEPQWKVVGDLLWVRGLLEKQRPMACLRQPLAAFTFLGDNLGASAKAHDEFKLSREELGRIPSFISRGVHACRKLVSCAYVRRDVTYDLFTLSDSSRRRCFTCESLGWTWPSLAKP